MATVDLRYVENVKIPEEFYYVGGTKNTGIVILDVKNESNHKNRNSEEEEDDAKRNRNWNE